MLSWLGCLWIIITRGNGCGTRAENYRPCKESRITCCIDRTRQGFIFTLEYICVYVCVTSYLHIDQINRFFKIGLTFAFIVFDLEKRENTVENRSYVRILKDLVFDSREVYVRIIVRK